VGQDNEGLEHNMDRHGLGDRNKNGPLMWISVLALIWLLAEQYFHISIVTNWHGFHQNIKQKIKYIMKPLDGNTGDPN
jgi:hypothetical protein